MPYLALIVLLFGSPTASAEMTPAARLQEPLRLPAEDSRILSSYGTLAIKIALLDYFDDSDESEMMPGVGHDPQSGRTVLRFDVYEDAPLSLEEMENWHETLCTVVRTERRRLLPTSDLALSCKSAFALRPGARDEKSSPTSLVVFEGDAVTIRDLGLQAVIENEPEN